MKLLSYNELLEIPTFIDRFKYLISRNGAFSHGEADFGSMRYVNQAFYSSNEWRRLRSMVVVRDGGCDLADPGHPIEERPIVHHINFVTLEMIENRDPLVLDPDNVILTSYRTHEAIHHGSIMMLPCDWAPRTPYDTCPWRS